MSKNRGQHRIKKHAQKVNAFNYRFHPGLKCKVFWLIKPREGVPVKTITLSDAFLDEHFNPVIIVQGYSLPIDLRQVEVEI